jgi:hypothetical protein
MNLKGCPMKVFVWNGNWYLTTNYIKDTDSKFNVGVCIEGFENNLLEVVCEQMNMYLHQKILKWRYFRQLI